VIECLLRIILVKVLFIMKRNTIQRALVLEAVNKLQCHATAEEIYNYIIKEHPTIGKGTVYRNLNLLSGQGEIRKIEVPGGADRFDYLCHDHYHIRCVNCGRVFDVEMDYMQGLEKQIKAAHGFEINGHDIMFSGICPECRNARGKEEFH
jgi:Fe2+ or Zn2+ uptake regulation protein